MSDEQNDEQNDELDELLKSLSRTDPIPAGSKEDSVVVPASPRPKAIDVSVPSDDLLMLQPQNPAEKQELSAVFSEQLQKVASQYGSVFEEIIVNYKKDREQAQEVIDRFMDVIASGGKVPRIYLEKIADAVRAKNEIAQTAIRALDSLPKLISATKGNDMFTNNVGISFDAAHLKEILDLAKADNK